MPTPNLFQANDKVVGGPLDGTSVWSNADNWTGGVPLNNATVDMVSSGDDDLDSRSIASLTVNGSSVLNVTGSSLTLGTVNGGAGYRVQADSLPEQHPVLVVVNATGSRGMLETQNPGAVLVDQAAADTGEDFVAAIGGLVELIVTPSPNSSFAFGDDGEFAFKNPGATNAAVFFQLGIGDVLELPGVSVSEVTYGVNSLSVSTSAGVYAFTDVQYQDTPTSYSTSIDPVTGLIAIAFSDIDLFQPTVKQAGGVLNGDYLWSNPDNWAGDVPVDGDTLSLTGIGYNDLAAANISDLKLNASSGSVELHVTGASLTVANLQQQGGLLEADAADAGTPVTVTLQKADAASATFEARGPRAKLLDQAASDTATNTYEVASGGLVELYSTPYFGDIFSYLSQGTFAFRSPGATVASLIEGVSLGDTIEVPGTMVSSITIGTSSLTIVTDAGSTPSHRSATIQTP